MNHPRDNILQGGEVLLCSEFETDPSLSQVLVDLEQLLCVLVLIFRQYNVNFPHFYFSSILTLDFTVVRKSEL
jgi:hypothetical protein